MAHIFENDFEDFFEKTAQIAPTILYVFDLKLMENVWINRSIFGMLGYTTDDIAAMGEDILQDLMHPEDWDRYPEHFEKLLGLKSDERASFDYRMRRKDGGWCWLNSVEMVYARDGTGGVQSVIGAAQDITEAREREERIRLLMREMNHRVKNLFSVVSALIMLSSRRETDVKSAMKKLGARVASLARVHDVSRGQDDPSDNAIQSLIREVLTPFDINKHVAVQGDNPELEWRHLTPLCLILHELATNAIKHGALGHVDGRILITVKTSERDLSVIWHEHNPKALGVPVKSEDGFGSVLIDRSTAQLGGEFTQDWDHDGLRAALSFSI
ncbi:sensor histidine kinase [Litoreibacter roseus]|uniref:histidine kinase n=1 Tax=Litoreibacter roseus TaxID=2601869 RepID=A0A6N6JGQ7_9RHOB|nr:PAS domain-containing protein [Litoreibacter roseus]GFE65304.1 hypothetical protein KIN_23780 [Litoreibacter roseus]